MPFPGMEFFTLIPVPENGNGIFITVPVPENWIEFSTWIPVPEKWECNLPFPVPVPEVQKSFPLMAVFSRINDIFYFSLESFL